MSHIPVVRTNLEFSDSNLLLESGLERSGQLFSYHENLNCLQNSPTLLTEQLTSKSEQFHRLTFTGFALNFLISRQKSRFDQILSFLI